MIVYSLIQIILYKIHQFKILKLPFKLSNRKNWLSLQRIQSIIIKWKSTKILDDEKVIQ